MRKTITLLAAAAAMLTVGSASAQAAQARVIVPGATPACGAQCFDLSSLVLGTSVIQNAYIAGDHGVGGKVGIRLNLKRASNSHPNEDFTGAQVGTLTNFCPNYGGTGLSATSYVCIKYPASYPVYEANWSPFGNETGLCGGAALPLVNGENVTLQTCGATATTLWVGDLANSVFRFGRVYVPWVNSAGTSFSHQLTLTVDPGTTKPINQLKLQPLNKLTGGVVPDTQQFTFFFGPV